MSTNKKVAIIGSGLIGRSWASIFTGFNYRVQLYDVNQEYLVGAPKLIREELTYLCENKIARGSLTLEERMNLISTTNSLEECLKDTIHIQECVFDDLAMKQDLFQQVDKLLGNNTEVAICSSTSIHLPSKVFAKVNKHKDQCLVAHPVNPPLHVRLVELIPCSETRDDILKRTRETMKEIGQKPVVLKKEVSGFALNRLQYAVFQEAFRLVHDGVMTPDDVDTVVSDGLGPRYAFMGPWMTAHLNATGLGDYFARYSDGIYNVSKDCQPLLRLQGEAAQLIADTMTHEVPIDKLPEKRKWRDECLTELAKLKDRLGNAS
uniref:Lambda-crystallin n=1 Tax=Aceria tosichella TaxID=561515 RepID=A0A6G1SDY1_9ACAR